MKINMYCFVIAAICFGCSKSGSAGTGNNGGTSTPSLTIAGVSQDRSASASTFQFKVTLSKAASQDVTVHYATTDGTAVKNTDYTAADGTATIAAGKLSAAIDIQVTGDSTRKNDQDFYVQLSDPKNCTLGNSKATGTIVNADGLYFPVDNTGYSTPGHYAGYTLAWSDEFNGNTLSDANWGFESGNNNGWGNHELEYYTDRTQNAFVSNGNLIIEARKEQYNSFGYTSARMITKAKQSFKFGRVDIRAKLPKGKGVWPALWMLGDNIDAAGWPACGEIDIMELLGQQPNTVYGTLHWGLNSAAHQSKGTSYVLGSGSFDEQFHVYSMVWVQDTVKLLVDDQQYLTVNAQDVAPTYPFNDKFFFIFNVAVGGDWPGAPDGTTSFPQRMVVDYVRVFQQ
ncbi:MAG TPA: family 16 glycosylhydrolase [Chitinophagaceae bacterium]|nr:family 16 glycosylhydrolase [Chitinophagaceae bacterium]